MKYVGYTAIWILWYGLFYFLYELLHPIKGAWLMLWITVWTTLGIIGYRGIRKHGQYGDDDSKRYIRYLIKKAKREEKNEGN